jgi:hypothetical protein
MRQIFHAASLRPLGLLGRPLVLQFLQINLGVCIIVVGLVIVGVGVELFILVTSASCKGKGRISQLFAFGDRGGASVPRPRK